MSAVPTRPVGTGSGHERPARSLLDQDDNTSISRCRLKTRTSTCWKRRTMSWSFIWPVWLECNEHRYRYSSLQRRSQGGRSLRPPLVLLMACRFWYQSTFPVTRRILRWGCGSEITAIPGCKENTVCAPEVVKFVHPPFFVCGLISGPHLDLSVGDHSLSGLVVEGLWSCGLLLGGLVFSPLSRASPAGSSLSSTRV
jgi:hypothetical protein